MSILDNARKMLTPVFNMGLLIFAEWRAPYLFASPRTLHGGGSGVGHDTGHGVTPPRNTSGVCAVYLRVDTPAPKFVQLICEQSPPPRNLCSLCERHPCSSFARRHTHPATLPVYLQFIYFLHAQFIREESQLPSNPCSSFARRSASRCWRPLRVGGWRTRMTRTRMPSARSRIGTLSSWFEPFSR